MAVRSARAAAAGDRLSARLRDGLVAAEGEQWNRQRRTLAPLFGRNMVMRFAPAMASAAAALIERWYRRQEDGPMDISEEMSRLTLDALVRTVLSDSQQSQNRR